jgi:hypothetical protein
VQLVDQEFLCSQHFSNYITNRYQAEQLIILQDGQVANVMCVMSSMHSSIVCFGETLITLSDITWLTCVWLLLRPSRATLRA